ncbi:MAG: hypothetical protein CM15mP12_5040 [Gammaproteobacteria bacterium]|nr:MAG: hypothetical protein CM15mP12_5040 [Gammaproteobacteria bacterium]
MLGEIIERSSGTDLENFAEQKFIFYRWGCKLIGGKIQRAILSVMLGLI